MSKQSYEERSESKRWKDHLYHRDTASTNLFSAITKLTLQLPWVMLKRGWKLLSKQYRALSKNKTTFKQERITKLLT